MTVRPGFVLLSLGLFLVLTFVWSLSVGAVKVPTSVILNTLFDLEGEQQRFIINRSRLPRSLLAMLTGSAMALSGAVVQALLRNALASPKIIGINSGAALAVLLGTSLVPGLALAWMPLVALLGGTLAAGAIYGLSAVRPMSPERLILVGIAVGMACEAGVDFIMVTASTFEISAPLVWLTGSLWARGWQHLAAVWPFIVFLSAVGVGMFFRLDLMRLGAAQAAALGVNVRLERLVLLAVATLLASLSVSVVGVIGFVGLMAPHIARQLVGGRHGVLLPTAMLIGALLVVLADATGRVLAPPIEVPAGILTAMFGAPFFVFVLLTSRMEARE